MWLAGQGKLHLGTPAQRTTRIGQRATPLASELHSWLGQGFGPGQMVPVVGFGCDARQQVCTMAGIGVDYLGPRWLGELHRTRHTKTKNEHPRPSMATR